MWNFLKKKTHCVIQYNQMILPDKQAFLLPTLQKI